MDGEPPHASRFTSMDGQQRPCRTGCCTTAIGGWRGFAALAPRSANSCGSNEQYDVATVRLLAYVYGERRGLRMSESSCADSCKNRAIRGATEWASADVCGPAEIPS